MLKSYDKEYMKMAMLKHEETFKQQVPIITFASFPSSFTNGSDRCCEHVSSPLRITFITR